jgi:hypothetical protein
MAHPPRPERANVSREESLPLDQSPMFRFRRLATRLLAVSRSELADAEKSDKEAKKPQGG